MVFRACECRGADFACDGVGNWYPTNVIGGKLDDDGTRTGNSGVEARVEGDISETRDDVVAEHIV